MEAGDRLPLAPLLSDLFYGAAHEGAVPKSKTPRKIGRASNSNPRISDRFYWMFRLEKTALPRGADVSFMIPIRDGKRLRELARSGAETSLIIKPATLFH